jgi:polyisoprenoid-binding protein YceI
LNQENRVLQTAGDFFIPQPRSCWVMRKGASFRGAVLALIAVTVAAEARSSWKIDPSQTHVRFWVDAIGWPRTNGEFKSFDGRIEIDFDRPSRSRVDFRVAARSVDANSASLNEHLRSEVFLNVTNFPGMRFISTSVEKRDEQHARVTGDLTLLGVTRPISLDVEVARKLAGTNQRVGFKATGVIYRTLKNMIDRKEVLAHPIDGNRHIWLP